MGITFLYRQNWLYICIVKEKITFLSLSAFAAFFSLSMIGSLLQMMIEAVLQKNFLQQGGEGNEDVRRGMEITQKTRLTMTG